MKYELRYERALQILTFFEKAIIYNFQTMNNLQLTLNLIPTIQKVDRIEIENMIKYSDFSIKYIDKIVNFTSKQITIQFKNFSSNELIDILINYEPFNTVLLPSNSILDKNMSKEWNKEQVMITNNRIKNEKMEHYKLKKIIENMLKEVLICEAIKENNNLNIETLNDILNEIIIKTSDYCNLKKSFFKKIKVKE